CDVTGVQTCALPIYVGVDLTDRVVDGDRVGQTKVTHRGIHRVGAVIGGKSTAVAGDRRSQCAPADLQADCAHVNSRVNQVLSLHAGDGIHEAVRRVAAQRYRGWGRNLTRVADRVPLPLVSAEEEKLPSNERPACW